MQNMMHSQTTLSNQQNKLFTTLILFYVKQQIAEWLTPIFISLILLYLLKVQLFKEGKLAFPKYQQCAHIYCFSAEF